jgi:hypothetical protein
MKSCCEICEESNSILLITHHIQSVCNGGSEFPSNLVRLCRYCHEKVHHGLIVIEGRWNSNVGNIVVFHNWDEPYVIRENAPEVWLYPNAKVNGLKKIVEHKS